MVYEPDLTNELWCQKSRWTNWNWLANKNRLKPIPCEYTYTLPSTKQRVFCIVVISVWSAMEEHFSPTVGRRIESVELKTRWPTNDWVLSMAFFFNIRPTIGYQWPMKWPTKTIKIVRNDRGIFFGFKEVSMGVPCHILNHPSHDHVSTVMAELRPNVMQWFLWMN